MNKVKIILSLIFSAMTCLFIASSTGVSFFVYLAGAMFLGCVIVQFSMKHTAMALLLCGSITACVKPDCNNPLVGGLGVEVYLANLSDVNDTTNSTITYDGSNPTLMTNWVMTVPKFYTYEGIKASNNDKTALAKGKYMTNFDHELDMYVFKVDAAAKKQLEQLSRGLVVAIVKNNYKGATGTCKWEVLGLGQGLEVSTLERDKSNADSQGAYHVVLKTPAGYSEPHLPAALFATDEATTDGIVAALLATCS